MVISDAITERGVKDSKITIPCNLCTYAEDSFDYPVVEPPQRFAVCFACKIHNIIIRIIIQSRLHDKGTCTVMYYRS